MDDLDDVVLSWTGPLTEQHLADMLRQVGLMGEQGGAGKNGRAVEIRLTHAAITELYETAAKSEALYARAPGGTGYTSAAIRFVSQGEPIRLVPMPGPDGRAVVVRRVTVG